MANLRLSLRLTLGILLVQALVLAILLWNGARQLGTRQEGLLEQHALEQSQLLAQTLAPAVAVADRASLLDALDTLKRNPHLRYAAIFNTSREPLAVLGTPPPLQQPVIGPLRLQQQRSAELLALELPILQGRVPVGLLQTGYSATPLRQAAGASLTQNLLIAAFGLLASALIVVYISLPLERGLHRLERGLAALPSNGDLGPRIPPGRDPLTPATERLNGLLDELAASRAELRGQYEQVLKEARRLNGLLHGINAVVWEVDPHSGQFVYVSPEAEQLSGHPPAAWLAPDFCQRYVHPTDLDWLRGFLTHLGNAADTFTLDFRLFNHINDTLWLRMISTTEIREQGAVLTGLLLNVTEEKRSEQRIAYLADHDPLTGLINRRRFQEKLEEQIAYNRRYSAVGALLFMDLDQFKYINDTYGHQTGDEYLRQVSHHLRSALRKTDIIGRLGGDEFGIILPKADARQTEKACEGLLKYLNSQEFIHDGRRTPFTASIGVALFPTHGDTASDLLAKADSAMYNAKDQGRNTFRIYEESIDAARMREKIHWESRIRQALAENRFQLYFQPIVDLYSGQISHYESLLRMLGDNNEVISPGAFIGIAERFGLIRDIDHWVVANAMRAQSKSELFGRPVALTVNLSGRHFGSREIVEVIRENTRKHKANPANIVFEVTETAAVENFTDACELIRSLREMGYRFALDDFGAGFSSFDYLKHLSVDYVKIDGSFVRNLAKDRVDRIFVNAIHEMAKGLGVKTIAEFVENAETVEVLREIGVNYGQGYYFAKPGPRFHEHNRIVLGAPAGAASAR